MMRIRNTGVHVLVKRNALRGHSKWVVEYEHTMVFARSLKKMHKKIDRSLRTWDKGGEQE